MIDWTYGATRAGGVSFARQNLPLIVENGKPAPNIENDGEWGATVGNAVLVWRSAVGVDAHGNLIYAAGEDQTVGSLARALIQAGAVRAMELDINSYWTSFITYGAPGAEEPKNLLAGMERPATRYLEPTTATSSPSTSAERADPAGVLAHRLASEMRFFGRNQARWSSRGRRSRAAMQPIGSPSGTRCSARR